MNSKRIHLSVLASYLDWSIYEGIREFYQNAFDAEKDGYSFSVEKDEEKGMLSLSTFGVNLPLSSLLIGFSSKKEGGYIGRFGEGYKLGCLALVQNNIDITITNQNEIWTPIFSNHPELKEKVLAFDIEETEEVFEGIRIEIKNIPQSVFQEIEDNIISEDIIKFQTEDGNGIILDESYSGKLFVGKIFVREAKDFLHGYNISPEICHLDRDRRTFTADIQFVFGDLITDIISSYENNDELIKEIYKELSYRIGNLYWVITHVFRSVSTQLSTLFTKEFGDKAYPIINKEDSDTITLYGMVPIPVGYLLGMSLSYSFKSIPEIQKILADSIPEVIEDSSLSVKERKRICFLRKIYEKADLSYNFRNKKISACEKNKWSILGVYNRKDNIILIERENLQKDFHQSIITLCHEIAHAVESTHSRTFYIEEENIFSLILKTIMENRWFSEDSV